MKAITAPTIITLLLAIARNAHLAGAGKQNIAPAAIAESLNEGGMPSSTPPSSTPPSSTPPSSTPPITAVPAKGTTIRELPIDSSQILQEPDTVLFGSDKDKPAQGQPVAAPKVLPASGTVTEPVKSETGPAKPTKEAIEKSLQEEPLVTLPESGKEAGKVEALKEPLKPELKKEELVKSEPLKPEPKKEVPVKAEEPKMEESLKPKEPKKEEEPAKPEPLKPELAKPELAKPVPVKTEPKDELAKPVPVKTEPKDELAKPVEKPKTNRPVPPAITSYRKDNEPVDKKAYVAYMEHLLAKDYASNIPAFSVEQAGHVRLVTFNTHMLQKLEDEPTSAGDTAELVIHMLRSLNPSIVHLQEVPSIKGSDPSKYDFIRFLQRLHDELGLKHVVHCDTQQISSLVIASRFPLESPSMFLDDISKGCFAIRSRVAIEADGFEPTRVQLVNAHLSKNAATTTEQAEHIAKSLEVLKDKQQFLVAADFNQPMKSDAVKLLKDRCAIRGVFGLIGWHPPTLSCWADVQVDGILSSQTLANAILGAYFRPTTTSDHMPGIVDIDFRKIAAKKPLVSGAPSSSGASSEAAAVKGAAATEAAGKAKVDASKIPIVNAEDLVPFHRASSATGKDKSRWSWPFTFGNKKRS